MIQAIIHRLLQRRHFWRYATFGEVAELYASRLMRIFALRMVSVFTAIYLYQEGFSLVFIAFFWSAFYGLKVMLSWPSALIVAKYGPKHGTLVSNIVSAVSMVLLPFATNPTYGLLALSAWCALQAFSGTLNDLSYLVDFSKVKNMQHAGKEIGYMNIIEKVATGLSPLIGGVLAFLFGPKSIMIISGLLFLASAVPLFMTAEPTKIRKKLDFSGFPWRTTWRSFVAESAVGADVFATGTAWSLFLVIAVFTSGTDKVYAEIGFISSVTIFVALTASYVYGKLIDHRKGKELLQFSALGNSVVHGLRIFVATPLSVVLLNIINEAATTGYSMPFLRGLFDLADISGKRTEYLFIIEMMVNLGAGLVGVLLGVLFMSFGALVALKLFFVILAVFTLLIATPKFALYRR